MSVRSACSLMACLLFASLGADGFRLQAQNSQENSKHPREARDSTETYAVYSAILANPPLSHHDDNTMYAIRDTILASQDRIEAPKTACAEIPEVSSESLAQIVSDFEQHKNAPVRLKRALSLSKPYVLLSPQQAGEFESWNQSPRIQTDPPSLRAVNPYSGAHDLIQLSGVFFDRFKRVAMVYMSARCGTLCGLWGWHILEKRSSGRWQEITTARCSATIS